jgi:hypothetical protein
MKVVFVVLFLFTIRKKDHCFMFDTVMDIACLHIVITAVCFCSTDEVLIFAYEYIDVSHRIESNSAARQ